MYKEYSDIESLKAAVLQDKQANGIDAFNQDRYPIRFVLLDNFRDCSLLVDFLQAELSAMVQSVDKWIDPNYPDLMLTHTELAMRIKEYIKSMNGADCVVAPFSELARFYDNGEVKKFDALLKTIKGIQSSRVAFEKHQRVYIPIVGLEGKMETFVKDSQSTIWRLKSENHDLTYRLILTDGKTFGVQGLESHYTVVNTMQEWLNIWKDADKQVTPNIICTSSAIFANADYAQPDNAFSFVICRSAYEFLTMGLQLPMGGLEFRENDAQNWITLASQVDVTTGFTFSHFVLSQFMINAIDDLKTFMRLWLSYPAMFERWLLSRYYLLQKEGKGYLCGILAKTSSLTGTDFIEQIALYLNENESDMADRRYCLMEAVKHHVVLRDGAQNTLLHRLEGIASKYNATSALKYFTGVSKREKELAISWLSKGQITIGQVKEFFPDLYYYYESSLGTTTPDWVETYMKGYKDTKLANEYSDQMEALLAQQNGSEVTFDGWYQDFSTVRTLLHQRSDIEVYYWIDGLGIEWIPLIRQILKEHEEQGIYLNEVKIARALLPTVTNRNKEDLQKLLPVGEKLEKSGDLDALAHQQGNLWPSSIVHEIEMVRDIIEDILQKYSGKKIAIISDHGVSYLPQLVDGLGLSGVESDHHGRIALRKTGTWTLDNHYFRLEDGKTVGALKHNSLCARVPRGQGSHGGCTPEEVLVPIFIISGFKNDATWTADLLTLDVSGTDPHVKFCIKNKPAHEIPFVEYNYRRYKLHQESDDTYKSEALVLADSVGRIDLIIGNIARTYNINIQTGAQEEDLFSF